MSDYVIGDIQGCYTSLQRLLDHVEFNDRVDRLWFVGDLVNRGPQSLEVLRFVQHLAIKPHITLGNHDLHLLACLFGRQIRYNADDTLDVILKAPDAEALGHWLRQQSILHHDVALNIVMCHAGIAPVWDLDKAKACAAELETVLHGPNFCNYLTQMYGNEPNYWSNDLKGMDRLRVIGNYFTRMRFCDANGRLVLNYKGTLEEAPENLLPWYALSNRCPIEADIVFGHWAALQGKCPDPRIYALDTGCYWGGKLTALRLQDRQIFSVPCAL